MRRKDIKKVEDGWRYTIGAIEVWVSRFDVSLGDDSDPPRQDLRATVSIALARDIAWQEIGRIRKPWGLTSMYLELGDYPRETTVCLHAHKDETALAAAMPYIVGYAAHVFEIRPAEVKT